MIDAYMGMPKSAASAERVSGRRRARLRIDVCRYIRSDSPVRRAVCLFGRALGFGERSEPDLYISQAHALLPFEKIYTFWRNIMQRYFSFEYKKILIFRPFYDIILLIVEFVIMLVFDSTNCVENK